MEGPPRRLSREKQSTPYLKTTSTKKKRKLVVIGNSLLREMGSLIRWLDPTCREVRRLPEIQVRDITGWFPSLAHLSDLIIIIPNWYFRLAIMKI